MMLRELQSMASMQQLTPAREPVLQAPDVAPATARRLHAMLRRMRNIRQKPRRVIRALELAATQLARESRHEAVLLREAARSMADNLAFFERLEKPSEN